MKNALEYLEIGIVEYCNLNCKGCSHFSPLAHKSDFIEVEEYETDIKRMSSLVPIIYKIRILGGEPLLHPNLNEIINITRQYYPFTEIHVVTNGLLLTTRKDELDTWANKDIFVDISMYPPTQLVKNEIEELLQKKKIKYSFTELISEFRKRMDISGNSNIEKAYKQCVVGSNCKYLYKGKLSGCPAPNVVRLFDRFFKHKLSYSDDMIDIHMTQLSTKEILEKLNRPLQMCRYCTQPVEIKWENNLHEYKEEDWIVEK